MLFSQQVKWNHFIMTSVYYVIYTKMYINSLFHRDETKPTHIKGINSFLFLMQLVYKHSSPNYQHMTNYRKLINKMLLYIYMRELKHFQPHSFLCHLWCYLIAIYSFLHVNFILCMIMMKVNEAASKTFFLHHTKYISQCYYTASTQSY